ncbi:MAG: hypothetical protein ABIZ91_08475 [Gemmatimonadaceae bacterium]
MKRTADTDEALQRRYAQLVEVRAVGANPAIDLEVMRALADGSYAGADRIALLEQLLAHPESARELRFLHEVARRRPAKRSTSLVPWLAAAAMLIVVVGGVARYGSEEPADTFRATPEVTVTLAGPVDGVAWRDSLTFAWQPVPGALSYRVEILDGDAAVVDSVTVHDTAVVRGRPEMARATLLQWSVQAHFADGTVLRSRPRSLRP